MNTPAGELEWQPLIRRSTEDRTIRRAIRPLIARKNSFRPSACVILMETSDYTREERDEDRFRVKYQISGMRGILCERVLCEASPVRYPSRYAFTRLGLL